MLSRNWEKGGFENQEQRHQNVIDLTLVFFPSSCHLCLHNDSLGGGVGRRWLEGSFKQLIYPGILRTSFHLYVFGN